MSTTSEATKATKKPAKRGRPAKLSRAQILECALQLLKEGPDKVTISGVARALNTAPMSLYTHVENRDDLVLGVSDLVLGQLDLDIDESSPWQDQVRSWLMQVHNHLTQYPQVMALLGEAEAIPPQWLRVSGILIRCLAQAGFKDRMLADITAWLGQMVVNDITINAPDHTQLREQALVEAMSQVSEEDKESFALIAPYINDTHQNLYLFAVDQVMLRLDDLLKQQ